MLYPEFFYGLAYPCQQENMQDHCTALSALIPSQAHVIHDLIKS